METDVEFKDELVDLGLDDDDSNISYQWVKQDPYKLNNWLWYIESKKDVLPEEGIYRIYEKAVEHLPGSYKLWYNYLSLRIDYFFKGVNITNLEKDNAAISNIPLTNEKWEETNDCFERSLFMCHKFPVIWRMYCSFLYYQNKVTRTRRMFTRALRHLPVTQHYKIWPIYLKFAEKIGGLTMIYIWRLYLRIKPEESEKYVEKLLAHKPCLASEAIRTLIYISEEPENRSITKKHEYHYWLKVCDVICEHAEEIVDLVYGGKDPFPASKLLKRSIDIEKIIKMLLERYANNVSQLWNALARIYITRGQFDMASDVYDEAIRKVKTLSDFSIIFDTYAVYEERRIEDLMYRLSSGEVGEDVNEVYIDIKLMKLEELMDKRHILMNDVLIRQNPNNVTEWLRRVAIYETVNDNDMVKKTYEHAIDTINPKKCDGKLYILYVKYADFLFKNIGIEAAREIYEKSVLVPYRRMDDLVELWKKYVWFEIEQKNIELALDLVERSVSPLSKSNYVGNVLAHNTNDTLKKLFKSVKMWEICLDIHESLGTFESTKSMYERAIELRVCTPQTIINYAMLLEDNKYYQESYRVYERGIQIFGYPIAYEILNVYISKFIDRYGSTKVERVRELFEQALDKCPPKFAKSIYLMCAKYEEDCGFIRNSIRTYEKGLEKVDKKDLFNFYRVYINKVMVHYGIPYTREIYQKAIEALPDDQAIQLSVQFANSEVALGETDRARAIYAYTSQISNPKLYPDFWKAWYDFEVENGNEDSFKEMLRIQRSIATKYNTEVGYLSLYVNKKQL